MKIKDMIMLWLIIGISLFFIGGMINSTFYTEDSEDDTAYKVSSTFKLIGLGILTSILIIGGIIGSDLNKYFRLTFLVIGLILLLIFTIASQFMDYQEIELAIYDEFGQETGATTIETYQPSTPGFELIAGILAITSIVIYKKYKNKG